MATAQVLNSQTETRLAKKPSVSVWKRWFPPATQALTIAATPTPMDLLSIALQNDAGIDVIERLTALKEKVMLREAEITFSDALSRVQAEVKRVAPDLLNPSTSSRYASYAAIDRVIRPIYTAEGMSLSFSHADCPKPSTSASSATPRLGPSPASTRSTCPPTARERRAAT